MKVKFIQNDLVLLRLEKGDEIMENIMKFCSNSNIKCARIQGIGAAENFDLAIYDKKKRGYNKRKIQRGCEILSLSGNITSKDNKPYIHIHVVIADSRMKAFGGHLNEATITATGEIFIRIIPNSKLDRVYDEEVNINVINI